MADLAGGSVEAVPLREAPAIYADTSVFGGVFEAKFEFGSRQLLALAYALRIRLVISSLVQREISVAPQHVRDLFDEILPRLTVLDITTTAETLRNAYLANGVLGRANIDDALHVALATTGGCSRIVSWNFRHIVSDRRIPLFNAVNVLCGYNEIGIFTPYEVIGDEH